eukprot:m.89589 g.89589  ORF g.89589 m.89589 type:complete len:494 (+) comp16446_c0_seq1:312-1793(+)
MPHSSYADHSRNGSNRFRPPSLSPCIRHDCRVCPGLPEPRWCSPLVSAITSVRCTPGSGSIAILVSSQCCTKTAPAAVAAGHPNSRNEGSTIASAAGGRLYAYIHSSFSLVFWLLPGTYVSGPCSIVTSASKIHTLTMDANVSTCMWFCGSRASGTVTFRPTHVYGGSGIASVVSPDTIWSKRCSPSSPTASKSFTKYPCSRQVAKSGSSPKPLATALATLMRSASRQRSRCRPCVLSACGRNRAGDSTCLRSHDPSANVAAINSAAEWPVTCSITSRSSCLMYVSTLCWSPAAYSCWSMALSTHCTSAARAWRTWNMPPSMTPVLPSARTKKHRPKSGPSNAIVPTTLFPSSIDASSPKVRHKPILCPCGDSPNDSTSSGMGGITSALTSRQKTSHVGSVETPSKGRCVNFCSSSSEGLPPKCIGTHTADSLGDPLLSSIVAITPKFNSMLAFPTATTLHHGSRSSHVCSTLSSRKVFRGRQSLASGTVWSP